MNSEKRKIFTPVSVPVEQIGSTVKKGEYFDVMRIDYSKNPPVVSSFKRKKTPSEERKSEYSSDSTSRSSSETSSSSEDSSDSAKKPKQHQISTTNPNQCMKHRVKGKKCMCQRC